MDEAQLKLVQIFMPRALRELQRLRSENIRFVHYTSADSALKILHSQKMLMRNSTLMNDFSEIQHGLECLKAAYQIKDGERLKNLMREVQSDLPEIFESNFQEQFTDIENETYLISISEHGDEVEDEFGRLSMWRAYAPKNGVAFIFNSGPFSADSEALNAFSSPVLYANPAEFCTEFREVVDAIEENLDYLKNCGGELFHTMLMYAFRFAVQSTKHSSFREEREWRVIYSPKLLEREGKMDDKQKQRLHAEVMSLGGVPQRVFAIPFVDYPEEGFVGATVPSLIEKILIGPSQDSWPIAEAFVCELERLGVGDARTKVVVTGIPLRH